MTNRDILKKLREQNVDIEITCVFSNRENRSIKIGYRYLITKWSEDNVLKKNIYTDDIYNTYEAAEIAAITRARSALEITL